MLLGAVDVAPLEVAQLYNAFANGGFSTPLRAVRAVVDAEGKPLKSFALEVTPVADPDAVYQVNRMLVQVMERGSGRAARAQIPAGHRGRRQVRHVLRLSRQLVRRLLGQSSRGRLDRLRRQLAHRPHRIVRLARRVVAADELASEQLRGTRRCRRASRKCRSSFRPGSPAKRGLRRGRDHGRRARGTELPVATGLRSRRRSTDSASGPREWWRGIIR